MRYTRLLLISFVALLFVFGGQLLLAQQNPGPDHNKIDHTRVRLSCCEPVTDECEFR